MADFLSDEHKHSHRMKASKINAKLHLLIVRNQLVLFWFVLAMLKLQRTWIALRKSYIDGSSLQQVLFLNPVYL